MDEKLSIEEVDQENKKLYSEVKSTQDEYDSAYAAASYEDEENGEGGIEPESSADAGVAASIARNSLAQFYNNHKNELHEIALRDAPKE